MSNRDAEQAVAGFYHLARKLSRQSDPDDNPVYRAMLYRIRRDEALRRLEEMAERWDWERRQG